MVTHRPIISTGETYHVYNRSIYRVNMFENRENLLKVKEIFSYYRIPQRMRLSKYLKLPDSIKSGYINSMIKTYPYVTIYAYSFMPNHYHFLLRQEQDNGISSFISIFQNSFAKYFNLKSKRYGALFQASFKVKRIKSNEEFIHVSRYIHLNHVTGNLLTFEQLLHSSSSSLHEYLSAKTSLILNKDLLLGHFGSTEKYIDFLKQQIDYQKKLKEIKDLLIDSNTP